jgi:MFS family permease
MVLNFCSAMSFWLLNVKIVQFAVDTYGVAESIAGLSITFYVISALFSRMVFGGRIDAWGVKRSIVIGSAINAIGTILYLVPMGFVPLLCVRVFHGVGFAIMSGATAAGAALVLPPERYGEGIGYYSMMQALATGIGPFVAIMLTGMFGNYRVMFVCSAIIAIIALLGTPFLTIPHQERAAKHVHIVQAVKEQGIGALIMLSVVPIASVLFLVYVCYAGIISFVTSYAHMRGLDDAVSFYFVVYAIVILISRPPVGRRIDRHGENSTIYHCLVSLVAGFVVLAFAVNGALLLASAVLVGFGIGATQSIIQTVIARDAPVEELGKANSTFFMSMDLGSGLGPVIIGAAIPVIGYSASYLGLAVLGVLAIVVYHFAHGRHH